MYSHKYDILQPELTMPSAYKVKLFDIFMHVGETT